MLSFILLNVVMLRVVMLNVVARRFTPEKYWHLLIRDAKMPLHSA
jgi:hypothetical protein